MKIHCNIIQDLLPLYHDEVCSQESKELVTSHLQGCENCRRELRSLQDMLIVPHPHPDDKKMVEAANAAWKKGKKKAYLNGVVLASIIMILIAAIFVVPYTKYGMIATIRIWENALTEFAQGQLERESSSTITCMGYRVNTFPESDCVFFEYSGAGYKGYFYSECGGPVGFQGTDAEFVKYGSGWLWEEQDGDNWMYAEHIVGNWYWYEMHF